MEEMRNDRTDVCIVGAGPSGLLLSLLLAKQGKRVIMLERQAEFELVRGGAVIQPATLKLLDKLNVLDQLRKSSQELIGVVEEGEHGVFLERSYTDILPPAIPFALAVPLVALRDVLLRLLQEEENIRLYMGAQVTALHENPQGLYDVEVEIGGKTQGIEARVIVGGDGKYSTVRQLAGIDAEMQEYADEHMIIRLPRPLDWPPKIRTIYDPNFMMALPVNGEHLFIFCSVSPEEQAAWREQESGLQQLRDRIAKALPELTEPLQELHSWQQIPKFSYQAVQAETWCRRNVVLMGDSAHSMHAIGGQGMNMALQDAALLTHVIEIVLQSGDYAALASYEQIRKPYVYQYQAIQQSLITRQQHREATHAQNSLYATQFDNLTLGQAELRDLLLT